MNAIVTPLQIMTLEKFTKAMTYEKNLSEKLSGILRKCIPNMNVIAFKNQNKVYKFFQQLKNQISKSEKSNIIYKL